MLNIVLVWRTPDVTNKSRLGSPFTTTCMLLLLTNQDEILIQVTKQSANCQGGAACDRGAYEGPCQKPLSID